MSDNQHVRDAGSVCESSRPPTPDPLLPSSPQLVHPEADIPQEQKDDLKDDEIAEYEAGAGGLSRGQILIQRRFSQIWRMCRATHDPYGHSAVDYWVVIDALGSVGDVCLNKYPTSCSPDFHKARQAQKLPPANCMICSLHFRRCSCYHPTLDSRMTRVVLGGIKEEAEFLCIRTAIFRVTGIIITLCHRIPGMVFIWVQTHLADTLYTMLHKKAWWSPLGLIVAKTVAGFDFLERVLKELRSRDVRCPFPRHAITVGPASLQGRNIGPNWTCTKSTSLRLVDDTHIVDDEVDAAAKTLRNRPFLASPTDTTRPLNMVLPSGTMMSPRHHQQGNNTATATSQCNVSWDKVIAPPPTITIGNSRTPLPYLPLPDPPRTESMWDPYHQLIMMHGSPSASSSSAAQSMPSSSSPSATFPHRLQNMEVSSCGGSSTTASNMPPSKHELDVTTQGLNISEMEG